MSCFDNPAFMSESKADIRAYIAHGVPPRWWNNQGIPERPKRAYRPWTPEDHRALALRLKSGETVVSAATALGLNPGSADAAISRHGSRANYIQKFTAEHL